MMMLNDSQSVAIGSLENEWNTLKSALMKTLKTICGNKKIKQNRVKTKLMKLKRQRR